MTAVGAQRFVKERLQNFIKKIAVINKLFIKKPPQEVFWSRLYWTP